MARIESAPQIWAATVRELLPAEGQCDACPAGPAVRVEPGEGPAEASMLFYPPTQTLKLDAEHQVAFAPRLAGGPIVLNTSALALAQHFVTPHTALDIPTAWVAAWGKSTIEEILAQMVHLGLLTSEESTDRPAA